MSKEINVELEDLRNEADALGIKFSKNLGVTKLKEKIDAYYKSQETSGKELQVAMNADISTENDTIATTVGGVNKLIKKPNIRLLREQAARKTRIVIITDNDQRVNNQTTTCTVNCSNEYFDLGTRILPLNEKIEVAQGHIDVLKDVVITLHAKDVKTGLSVAKTRNRYSISYED